MTYVKTCLSVFKIRFWKNVKLKPGDVVSRHMQLGPVRRFRLKASRFISVMNQNIKFLGKDAIFLIWILLTIIPFSSHEAEGRMGYWGREE